MITHKPAIKSPVKNLLMTEKLLTGMLNVNIRTKKVVSQAQAEAVFR